MKIHSFRRLRTWAQVNTVNHKIELREFTVDTMRIGWSNVSCLGEQRLGTRLILRVNPKTKQIDVQSGEGICRYYINEKRKSVENDFSAGKLFVIPRLFTKKSFLNFNKYNFSERYGMHKAQ